MNKDLINYCETNIIPKYLTLDLAHQPNHVYEVIQKSLEIAQDYEVDLNMVYVIAVFHDLGLTVDRKLHHIEGGKILDQDTYIPKLFSKEKVTLMIEAIEDHRASNSKEPRSVYGKIISEADRLIDPVKIILRCIQFQISKSDDTSFKSIYPSVKVHLNEKYGHNGYLRLWLKTQDNDKQLGILRTLIDDETKLYKISKKLHMSLIKEFGL